MGALRFLRCLLGGCSGLPRSGGRAALFLAFLIGLPGRAQAPTPAQQAWIRAHPVIRVTYDPSSPPLEFLDEHGQPAGLAPDTLRAVAARMGLKLAHVQARSWEEALDLVRRREADMVTNATPLPERSSYLAFSRPWIDLPDVILTRQDGPSIDRAEAMAGRKIAVVKGYSSRTFLMAQVPSAQFLDVPDQESALKELSFGSVEAAVCDLASASWIMARQGITNLRLTGIVGSPQGLTLACRSDWPELRDILDAGLAALSPGERKALRQKWIDTQATRWRPTPRFWAGLAIGAALVLSAVILAWNRSLRAQVAQRTRELDWELKERTRVQQEKDRFVAMVTHELRTPLTSLQGALELCGDALEEADRRRFLRIARENCERLIRITNDVLDHEKLQSRRMDLDMGRVDPGQVLHRAVEINRTFAAPMGVALVLDVEPGLPAVRGDADRLIQVATNLISNAAKWSPRGSQVTVGARLVPGGVRMEVVDRGPGIRKEFQDRVFLPYEQPQALPNPHVKGTGLGLTICCILLEHHGAKLELESEEGKGSTFYFTLPLAE